MPTASHIALLLPSVDKAATHLRSLGFETGEAETWDGEGTKEIYVGQGQANALLLMEPYKTGAYSRALEKRGPGLHHLAIDVEELEVFILSIAGSGWLLHPRSVATMPKTRTAWLARPGFPGLIEVQERKQETTQPLFVETLELPYQSGDEKLLNAIGFSAIVKKGTELKLHWGSRSVLLSELL